MINGINGSYFGMGYGMDNMIMQSSEDADRVIEQFRAAIEAGYNPNDVSESIMSGCGDLTEFDRVRIKRTVEQIYRAKRG